MTQTPVPLRIALVASSLSRAGAEKQFVYLATTLCSSGVEARVFHLSGNGYYESVLKQTNVPLQKISYPGKPLRILFKLIQALSEFKPHIVLASQFCDIWHAALAGHFHRALTVGGVRSDGFWEFESNGWRGRPMLHLPHFFLTNSINAKSNLSTLGLDPKKIFLLPNVIDLKAFDIHQTESLELPLPANRPIVLAAGRLHSDKRFDRFIKALSLARQKVPELYGVLAGKDDGAKSGLIEVAKSFNLLPDHLLFAGECPNIPALLARAQLLLLTSDIEGVPNIVLEAMAGRLPVITTPTGDAPHLVEHGKSGLVVNYDDIAGMAQAMVEFAKSPELRSSMGEAGRRRVETNYEIHSLGNRAIEIFQAMRARRRNKQLLKPFRSVDPAQMA